MNLEAIQFEDVSENDQGYWSNYIEFTIQGFDYTLLAYKPTPGRKKFLVRDAVHRADALSICPLCERPAVYRSSCKALTNQLAEVMERLVSSPALRLPWLYREYEIHQKKGE